VPEAEPESDQEMKDAEEEIAADLDQLGSILQLNETEGSECDVPPVEELNQTDDSDDEKGFEVVKRTAKEAQWEEEEPRKDGKLGKQAKFSLLSYD
jgi:hypothetical protein